MTIPVDRSAQARQASENFIREMHQILVDHFRKTHAGQDIPQRWMFSDAFADSYRELPAGHDLGSVEGLRSSLQRLQRDGFDESLYRDYMRGGLKDLIGAGKVEEAKMVIEAFDVVNMGLTHNNNSTPLLEAVRANLSDLCRWLIERGADVDFQSDNAINPLAAAVVFADMEIVEMMLDAGADQRDGARRGSALYFCIRNGGPPMLRLLVERGADIKARLLDGYTPLTFAAKSSDTSWAIDELVALGLDPNEPDGFDMRPVDWGVTSTSPQASDRHTPADHPLVRLARAGADFDQMLERCANSLEENLSAETLRELRSVLFEKKLHSAMSGVPNAEDFVHNGPENGQPHPKSGGFSPL